MFFYQCKGMSWSGKAFMLAFATATVTPWSALQADTLSPGYSMQTLNTVTPDGQFTAYAGQIHYWTSSGGYQIYNTTSGSTTNIGLPKPNGTISNGAGDAFGVFDPANNVFYAATVAPDFSSYIYEYNGTAGGWSNSGSEGVHLASAFGGQVYNGQLYVSGGSSTTVSLVVYGQNAIAGNSAPQTLGQVPGYSGFLAVDSNGDLYFAPNNFYYNGTEFDSINQWTASQIHNASLTPLTIANAAQTWVLPGNGNGLAVDSAGNVFFAVNDQNTGISTLGMLDTHASNGEYDPIYVSSNFNDYFGAISVDGNLLNGGTLYFNPGIDFGSALVAIQVVPEPGSLALLAAAGMFALVAWRGRCSQCSY